MKVLSKYIFEVIVIFIGITMSFIFEEWRVSRSDNQKEKEYYSLLLSDLESDSIDLEDIFDGIKFEQPRLDSILKKSKYDNHEQFSYDMCAAFALIQTQNLIKSFESIKQSGDLKLLKLKGLLNKCNLILAEQAALNHRIKGKEETWRDYNGYLSRTYPDMALFCAHYQSRINKGKITARDVDKFMNDPQIMIYYNKLLWASRSVNSIASGIKKELNELETMLKKEIN